MPRRIATLQPLAILVSRSGVASLDWHGERCFLPIHVYDRADRVWR